MCQRRRSSPTTIPRSSDPLVGADGVGVGVDGGVDGLLGLTLDGEDCRLECDTAGARVPALVLDVEPDPDGDAAAGEVHTSHHVPSACWMSVGE